MTKQQDYWRNPPNTNNDPKEYIKDETNKKGLLLDVMEKYVDKSDSIMEIGCNIGRNLNVLQEAGYKDLAGVEINEGAIRLGQTVFPNLTAKIHKGAVEDIVEKLPEKDVIYSLAVFEHLPYSSDWIFDKLVEKARKIIITIEDEKNKTWKHFPRNYQKIFKDLKQVYQSEQITGGELDGFIIRVFQK